MKPLDMFNPGEEGQICEILQESPCAHKLMTMGLLPGTKLEVLRIAPLGGPMAIKVNQSQLALRKKDAMHVIMEQSQTKS